MATPPETADQDAPPPEAAPAAAASPAAAPDEATALHALRRILVALDASAHSHAALAAAVTLATRFQSDIEGLFVEDINLVRLSELPFAREFRFGQAGPRQVESEAVQRGLRARAALLRHELEELTSEHKLRGSFRVARGAVAGEVLAAAREADLLALGRMGHSLARRARLGSTARAAIANAVSAVLLVQPEIEAGPVLVFYDGSAAGGRALALAAQLAGDGNELRVLVWGPDEETAFERRQAAAQALGASEAQLQHLAGGEAGRVVTWINRQHGSLLFLPTGGEWPVGMLDALLDDARPHLLLIR